MISQEFHVFAGTVRDNLLLAGSDADDARVREAVRQVGAEDLMAALPDGLDTMVGRRAHELTAAAAQHLALARVVLADPAMVILDEPSAEAGSAHATVLDDAVARAIEGRAALVIVHRLSQAVDATRVVMMSGGRVIEEGGHDQLLAHDGEYAALWRAWERGRVVNR